MMINGKDDLFHVCLPLFAGSQSSGGAHCIEDKLLNTQRLVRERRQHITLLPAHCGRGAVAPQRQRRRSGEDTPR